HFLFTFFSFSLSFLFFSNYTSITEIYTLSLHDALPIFPHDEIHPYIQTAAKDNAQFTLKTDPEYKTDPGSLAVVVAAKTAVYQSDRKSTRLNSSHVSISYAVFCLKKKKKKLDKENIVKK